jgi:hypothetical protein
VTPKSAPTAVIKLNPIKANGTPKPAYSVEAGEFLLDCAPYTYPSLSAISNNIYACGGTATNADVCWIEPDADHAFCDIAPWDNKLKRFNLSRSPVAAVKPIRDPQAWGLVLADGTQCLRRIGGA